MERKPKVTFFYPLIIYGGVEIALRNLLQRIHNRYDCNVVYTNGASDFNMLFEYSKYANVVKLNGTFETDVAIHCSIFGITNLIEANAYAQWIHLNVLDMKYPITTNDNIDKYIAVSEESANQFEEATGKKCMIIHNEIDIDIHNKANQKVEKIFKKETKLKILTVSRIAKFKGFDRIPMFCNYLDSRNIDYEWVIIGEGHQKPFEREVRERLSRYKRVKFIGKKENPYPYMKQAHFIAQLSDSESMGLSPVEGQTLGIPSLVTNYKSASEFINDGVNGYILDMDLLNADDVIDKILNKKLSSNIKYEGEYQKFIYLIDELLEKETKNNIQVQVKRVYNDKELGRKLNRGKRFYVDKKRARFLQKEGLCDIIKIRKGEYNEYNN